MEEILLDLKNVRKQYANFSLECSMQVKRGSITGLIGANGAGKTTIFKASLGLIHTDGGEIRMMGKTPQQLTNEEWEKIGVVLSDATFPNILTAEDAGAILKKMYHRFDKADFEEKCRTFAIPMNKKMKEMSTGMKAKLKILMAMSHQAEILILDGRADLRSGCDGKRGDSGCSACLYGAGRAGNSDQFAYFRGSGKSLR